MRKIATITMLTLLCTAAAFAQQKGTLKDARDKKTYKTVKIGTQTWMAENLNYEPDPGNNRVSPCYDDKPANCAKYGRIYFGSREDIGSYCPGGWHLPSDREWQMLIDFAGKDAGKNLKAKSGWKNNGTDKFGFAALPGGLYFDGTFAYIGEEACWYGIGSSWGINDKEPDMRICGDASYVRCVQGDAETAAKLDAEWAEAKAAEAKAKAEAEAKAKADAEAKAKAEAEAKAAALKANSGTFTDSRDKRTYKTIKIGNQVWLAENLAYNATGSKCYNNNPLGCEKYGRLYDWKTALASCPNGWHLPTDAEWDVLVATAGGAATAGEKLKSKSDLWINNAAGSDEFGFSALPGGQGFSTPRYNGELDYGSWWSATESKDNTKSNYRRMLNTSKNVANIDDPKTYFFSVRCLQGEPGAEAKAAIAKEQQKQAEQQKQQAPANEFCQITFPKKSCISMPAGTCKMSGGKVVNKCP